MPQSGCRTGEDKPICQPRRILLPRDMADSHDNPAPPPDVADRKALALNLDASVYGTFAEIGAGQEVVRHFFKAGGASGTVAKSMSAYDMAISDAIYGHPRRYVSRERLSQMLAHEYELLVDRLAAARGKESRFFVFADTVATTAHDATGQGHCWMGLRFQHEPGAAPSDIILHLRLWDRTAARQQDALGVVGVNLIHAAFHARADADTLLRALVEGVGPARVEVDQMDLSGPAVAHIDPAFAAVRLVRLGLTDAVLFGPSGQPEVPGDFLYHRNVLVARGFLRPVSRVNLDMLEQGARATPPADLVRLLEISLRDDTSTEADVVARARLANELGLPVLVSRYRGYYRLPGYLRRYTQGSVTLVAGINNLVEILNTENYSVLEGGLLEALGRLFKSGVRLLVYPMSGRQLNRLYQDPVARRVCFPEGYTVPDDAVVTLDTVSLHPAVAGLLSHLRLSGSLAATPGFDPDALRCQPRTLAERIRAGEAGWEAEVDPRTAASINRLGLWRA